MKRIVEKISPFLHGSVFRLMGLAVKKWMLLFCFAVFLSSKISDHRFT